LETSLSSVWQLTALLITFHIRAHRVLADVWIVSSLAPLYWQLIRPC